MQYYAIICIVVDTSGITDWSIAENMEMLKAVELYKLLGAAFVPFSNRVQRALSQCPRLAVRHLFMSKIYSNFVCDFR